MSEVIETELSEAIRASITKRRKFYQLPSEMMTDEMVDEMMTSAAMAALVDHLHDPRTIERVAQRIAKDQGLKWHEIGELGEEFQGAFRTKAIRILKEVLHDS